MKTKFFIASAVVCFAALLFTGCQSSQSNNASTEPTDTIVAEDTVPAGPLMTPDLKWAQLHGNVKQVDEVTTKTTIEWFKQKRTYEFDQAGQLISEGEIERDSLGRIVKYTYKTHLIQSTNKNSVKCVETFDYDPQGYVILSDAKYSYKVYKEKANYAIKINSTIGEDGLPVSAKWEGINWYQSGITLTDFADQKIQYLEYDSCGNWTKRKIKHHQHSYKFSNSPKVSKLSNHFVYTTYRTITYWE